MQMLNLTPFPELTTDRLFLRQLTEFDQDAIFALRSDEDNMRYLDRARYTSIDESVQFIEFINNGISENKWVLWAICRKEQSDLVGTVCLWNIDTDANKAEVGYELSAGHQGKGIMQEAMSATLDYGFNTLKLKSIEAHTHPCNEKSANLLKKFHFVRVKKKANPDKAIYTLLSCLRCRNNLPNPSFGSITSL